MTALNKKKVFGYCLEIVIAVALSMLVYYSSSKVSILFAVECFFLFLFFEVLIFNQRDRFGPLSFFLLSLFLGVIDIVFAVLKVRMVGTFYDIQVYEKSLFLIILWLVFFCVAYALWMRFGNTKTGKVQTMKRSDGFFSQVKKINVNTILVVGLLAQIFVFYKIITTIFAVGGFSEAINNFAIFRFNDQNYLLVFIYLLSFVPPALYEKGYKKTALVALVLNFIIIALTGRRGIAITTVIISMLVYVHYRIKPISNKIIAMVLAPIVAFILLIGSFRGQNVSLNGENSFLLDTAAKITNTVQYGDNIPDMVDKVDSMVVDFQGGRYVLTGLIGIIPRAIWAEKPEIDHSSISSQLVYQGSISYGRPVGAFGFAYLCFGYGGVIISGLICGLMTALFYCWSIKKRQTVFSVLIYAITIQFVMSITNPESQTKILFIGVVIVATKVLDSFIVKRLFVKRSKKNVN